MDDIERLADQLLGDTSGWQPTGVQPIGYQGAAQHTYTRACDGFHEPGPCPEHRHIFTMVTGGMACACGERIP